MRGKINGVRICSLNDRQAAAPALTLMLGLSLLFSASDAGAGENTEAGKDSAKQTAPASDSSQANAEKDKSKGAADRQEVLEPGRFFGMASFGYAAARAKPEIMEKLFCYCGCDLTDKHQTLLDCFTSMHGVDCHICQEEAILAVKMDREGASMADIQKAVDEKYAHEYPFEQDTPNYRQYKNSRLYIQKSAGEAKDSAASAEKPPTKNPTLKPGAKVSNCCQGKDEKKEKHEKNDKGNSNNK
jgi:hypothetical protein